MNRKVLSLIILFFGLLTMVNAQEDNRITIKGVIIDGATNEPIPFANLGILGTTSGAASNIDGNFELIVPEKYANHTLRVSVIGYSSYDAKVSELKGKTDLKIVLQPMTYSIKEVDVYAESLVFRKMIRLVVENIGKNYISNPYNYQGYFKYAVSVNGMENDTKEAVVMIYDNKGYHRGDVLSGFKELNYKFSEVRKNPPAVSVLDGLTYFDDIITADIIRNTRNVLDLANSRDYKLKNKGKLLYEGDSVQVIGYEVEKPTPSTSGDASVSKYSGEIYINLKDYAVLKNVVHITARDFNSLGRNLVPVGEAREEVKMTITTNYKKLNAVYFLSGVTLQYTYKTGTDRVEGEMQFITTKVNMKTPEVIQGRMYYEDVKLNKRFWDTYSVYFEGDE